MGLDISLTTKTHDIDFRKHNYLFRYLLGVVVIKGV